MTSEVFNHLQVIGEFVTGSLGQSVHAVNKSTVKQLSTMATILSNETEKKRITIVATIVAVVTMMVTKDVFIFSLLVYIAH